MHILVKIAYMESLNFSFLAAGIPFIKRIEIRNLGKLPISRQLLCLSVDSAAEIRLEVPELPPGRAKRFRFSGDGPIRLAPRTGGNSNAPELSCLRIKLGGKCAELPITLLSPAEWEPSVTWDGRGKCLRPDSTIRWTETALSFPSGAFISTSSVLRPWKGRQPLQAAAAAFVLPDHPEIRPVRTRVVLALRQITADPHASVADYASCGNRLSLLKAVYSALVNNHGKIFHDVEPFSPYKSQRIRYAQCILDAGANDLSGAACIEYVFRCLALLESLGLPALLVLVEQPGGLCHALLGCRLNDSLAISMLQMDSARFRNLVERGEILLIDVTEYSKGKAFSEACESAISQLEPPNRLLYALDIYDVRSTFHVLPLPLPRRPCSKEKDRDRGTANR